MRFTIQRRGSGRRVKHAKKTTCDKLSKSNRKATTCVRYTTLTGSFSQSGRAGANTVRVGSVGTLDAECAVPAIVAAPTANGRAGHTVTVAFRVIR